MYKLHKSMECSAWVVRIAQKCYDRCENDGTKATAFGGIRMDMFMDKLAQRLNAQEIIKANTAADTEELNRLKNQLAQYEECLSKLRQLVDEGGEGLRVLSKESAAEISRLAEESISRMQQLQTDTTVADGISALAERLDNMSTALDGVNAGIEKLDQVSGQVDAVNGRLDGVQEAVSAKVDQLLSGMENKADNGLEERLVALDENVHKECVKVYRNVQAVIVEEGEKQTKALSEIEGKVNSFRGKLSAVLGISIAALVFSIAGVVLSFLQLANWKLF